VRREQREDRQRGKLEFRGACGGEDWCCPQRWLARGAATRGGIVVVWRRGDRTKQGEMKGRRCSRRSDVGTFIRCCVFLVFFELGSHISGVAAVGPSLGFLRKVSLCSAGSYSATAGTHSSATISNCKKNRPENPATPTNKGRANNKK